MRILRFNQIDLKKEIELGEKSRSTIKRGLVTPKLAWSHQLTDWLAWLNYCSLLVVVKN